MSLAPRVGSQLCLTCLQTGVSLGNWPTFDTKSRKYHMHLESSVGTEHLKDVALEQYGKAWGSWRLPR